MYKRIFGLLTVSIGLSACSENNLEYYQSNLDDAQEKVLECETDMKDAFASQDEAALKAVSEDAECRHASKANSIYKAEMAKIKREKQREEQKLKKEQEEIAYSKEYESQLLLLSELPFEDFFELKKKCNFGGGFFGKVSAQCKAHKELLDGRISEQVTILIEQYKGSDLASFSQKSCKGISHNEPFCDVSRKAVRKQRDDQIALYLDDRDLLKADFNECHSKYKSLNDQGKRTEANQYIRTYVCSTVAKAASKLKVHSFRKPIA